MPAWPGGPCPDCGEYMPENLIHCQSCRALLNSELDADSVEIPVFVPLREIVAMVEVELRGYYVGCPECDRELRVNRKYAGTHVKCKFCNGSFLLDLDSPVLQKVAFYADCPHCKKELRAAMKYVGARVACKMCNGQIHFLNPTA